MWRIVAVILAVFLILPILADPSILPLSAAPDQIKHFLDAVFAYWWIVFSR